MLYSILNNKNWIIIGTKVMNYKNKYDEIFKKVSIANYENFNDEVHKQWDTLKNQDYSIPKSCQFYDFFSLKKEDLHDRFSVYYNNVLFDCLMTEPSSEKEKKTLFVIFSGSKNEGDPVPVFKRWSYFPFCDGYVLNIADPMLSIHRQMKLGWYYGTKNESYIEYVAAIIQKVQSLLDIENRNTFLFGSSGGGYVSLHLSYYLDNTTHIALNPQISIKDYRYTEGLKRAVGISSLDAKDEFRRNETVDIICENISSNRFLIIQNMNDGEHCQKQLFPLMKKLNVDSLNFGMNQINSNMLVWMYDLIGGHSAQGDQLIFSYIIYMAERLASENFELSDFESFLFKNISCLWKQREWYKYISDRK